MAIFAFAIAEDLNTSFIYYHRFKLNPQNKLRRCQEFKFHATFLMSSMSMYSQIYLEFLELFSSCIDGLLYSLATFLPQSDISHTFKSHKRRITFHYYPLIRTFDILSVGEEIR